MVDVDKKTALVAVGVVVGAGILVNVLRSKSGKNGTLPPSSTGDAALQGGFKTADVVYLPTNEYDIHYDYTTQNSTTNNQYTTNNSTTNNTTQNITNVTQAAAAAAPTPPPVSTPAVTPSPVVPTVTAPSHTQMIQTFNQNQANWYHADTATQAQLHQQNMQIAQVTHPGSTYNDSTGYYSFQKDQIQAEIARNAAAWNNADAATREQLHERNLLLNAQIGKVYDPSTGTYH